MNRLLSSFIIISVSGFLTGQEYTLLKSAVPNESFIKKICLSDLTEHSGICADCDTIAKAFELNQKAGYINSLLEKNNQEKTTFLFSSGAKMLRQKKLQTIFDDLENKSNDLAPEYSASILRLLSCVEVDKSDFDDLWAYETKLLGQGIVNAATNTSVEN